MSQIWIRVAHEVAAVRHCPAATPTLAVISLKTDNDDPLSKADEQAYLRLFPPDPVMTAPRPTPHVVRPSHRLRTKVRTQLTWTNLLAAVNATRLVPMNGSIEGRAICIFHNEKNPSLTFWRSGHFACMGCGKHGDMTDFVISILNWQSDWRGVTLRQLKAFFREKTSLHL